MAFTAALAAAGLGLGAYGRYRGGKSAKKAAKFEARQLEQRAGQVKAVSQRNAQEVSRQGDLQMSRALAVAAASGGGVSDPTVMDVMGDIAGDTDYRRMVALYEGETAADELLLRGQMRRTEGDLAMQAGQIGALGTVLSGGTSMYARYNKDLPSFQDIGNKAGDVRDKIGDMWHELSSKAFPGGPRKLR